MLNVIAALAVAVLFLFGAPDRASAQPTKQHGSADPRPRIISLAPAITESLFAIGAGANVVGTMEHSNRPEAARRIARVGGHSGLDYERIIALNADVIIAWEGGTAGHWITRLKQLGYRLESVTVYSLDDIADSLETLGNISGHIEQAARQAELVRKRLQALRMSFGAARERQRPRTFYQVWAEPLLTINDRHVISDAIRLCGGSNGFGRLKALVPQVGAEDVLLLQPQVIVTAQAAGEDADPFTRWRAFPDLPAVRDQRMIILDADLMSRPTAAMLDAVHVLCQAMAP